jgi:hypothetical protein
MGFFGTIGKGFSAAKGAIDDVGDFFDDPFGLTSATQSEIGKVKDKFGITAGQKTVESITDKIVDFKEDATTTAVDIATGEKEEEETDDIPEPQKAGFFQNMLKNLPGALGVMVAKDPGQALLQVLRTREQAELEKERQKESRRQAMKREGYTEKQIDQKERELDIAEAGQAHEKEMDFKELGFRQQQAWVDAQIKFREEEGRMDRTNIDDETRRLQLQQDLYKHIDSEANDKWIAELNANASMAQQRFASTANASLQIHLQNMRSSDQKQKWLVDAKYALTLASGDARAAENIAVKMYTMGTEALTKEEMAVVEKAKTQKLTDDDIRKSIADVGIRAFQEYRKPQRDLLGQELPGKTAEEAAAHANEAINFYAEKLGVQTTSFWAQGQDSAAAKVTTKQSENFEKMKTLLKNIPTEQHEQWLRKSLDRGLLTEEQAKLLGWSQFPLDPAATHTQDEEVLNIGQ